MSDKVFFDTNVLVYANDSSEPGKQGIAGSLIKDSLRKQNGVISVQVLGEFWITVTQKIATPLSIEIAEKEIELFKLMEVVSLDYLLFKDAIRFQRVFQISYWDSLILAASHSAGCATIYTEDLSPGQTINDMELSNPFL